jgi:osmotically-inducible protein OsmY
MTLGRSLAASAFAVALWLTGTAMAQDQPASGTVGEKVDSAVQNLKKSAQDAGEALRQQYEKARTSIHNMGVSSRVYGRLHWDKALSGAKVDVDVRQDGVATLTGSVPDAIARAKAVELTRDTVGVTKVVDRLVMQSAAGAAPVSAPPASKP